MSKALFICKSRVDTYGVSFGLLNSATFVSESLKDMGIRSNVTTVIDANAIDGAVMNTDPTHVFIEAIWVTPEKFDQLLSLRRHKNRKWIVRIHSKAPFIANEGIAMDWLSKYKRVMRRHPNLHISCNSLEFNYSLSNVLKINSHYLPNIYNPRYFSDFNSSCSERDKDEINIGCFGAVRPLKNHLNQALAAILFADKIGKKLRFHVNAGREEQRGDQVFKNLRATFASSRIHNLVEHGWLCHSDFLKLVSQMDLGMQVSLSETFNIVAADFVKQGVPIVVSPEISWMPRIFTANPSSSRSIVRGLKIAYFGKLIGLEKLACWKLERWNFNAEAIWSNFFYDLH